MYSHTIVYFYIRTSENLVNVGSSRHKLPRHLQFCVGDTDPSGQNWSDTVVSCRHVTTCRRHFQLSWKVLYLYWKRQRGMSNIIRNRWSRMLCSSSFEKVPWHCAKFILVSYSRNYYDFCRFCHNKQTQKTNTHHARWSSKHNEPWQPPSHHGRHSAPPPAWGVESLANRLCNNATKLKLENVIININIAI